MITHIKMLLYSCLYERYRCTFHSFLLLKMIPYINVTVHYIARLLYTVKTAVNYNILQYSCTCLAHSLRNGSAHSHSDTIT